VSVTRSTALDLWIVLARAFAGVQARAEADIRSHGLTPGEFGVLEALYHKGPQKLGEIQEKILVSSGGVTYLVDQLEGKKLVRRDAKPGDRRVRVAVLTEAGRSLIAQIFPGHAAAIDAAMAGLTSAEQEQARALLIKLGKHAAGAKTRARKPEEETTS
jgi:MarR family 2-MHQ and catechol resistance regulon transcriptional repressor